ncbi:DUF2780 domain-containing protein [Singulisphaera acidiphila]|uniref:DUF2780 domain-containing protein n=1 Tax=Singulisphaera acidiphila (strain ATCC BAA-1392 / DSM 18658 / VKM B-2454 / MOB10) TaxID=886293 RepID=L0D6P9_SINAD|nr:DUF2780 domain-containing protein [Singulisphaera acidiphila]AGA24508.1 Protein of unknown function VcgC/VcgE (DUF2780) [Singulisphaera acidiphila DSM 18658]
MSDIVTALSSQTGIDGEMVKKGLGTLLTFLQKSLPPDLFSKLQAALPGASEMLSAHKPDHAGAGSGLLGMVSGLAGKLFGGSAGNGAHLLSDLSHAGLSAEQIEAFLPRAFEQLKAFLPAELLEKVKAALPTLTTPAETGGS